MRFYPFQKRDERLEVGTVAAVHARAHAGERLGIALRALLRLGLEHLKVHAHRDLIAEAELLEMEVPLTVAPRQVGEVLFGKRPAERLLVLAFRPQLAGHRRGAHRHNGVALARMRRHVALEPSGPLDRRSVEPPAENDRVGGVKLRFVQAVEGNRGAAQVLCEPFGVLLRRAGLRAIDD